MWSRTLAGFIIGLLLSVSLVLNLNLLLVKLKSQLAKGLEQESCDELQQFFIDNQRSLSLEIQSILNSKAEAVS